MKYEPANTIIRYLGGARSVATIVGKHPSRIYKWALGPDHAEGQSGVIPARDQIKLLEYCKRNGIDLRPEDFFSANRLKSLDGLQPCARS